VGAVSSRKRLVSRILYSPEGDGDHSSGPFVTERLERPTRKRRPSCDGTRNQAGSFSFPYLALHREEFTWPPMLPPTPVSFYLTVSPITSKRGWSILCCTCRRPLFTGARMLSGSLPFGVRTFLSSCEKRSPGTSNCLAYRL